MDKDTFIRVKLTLGAKCKLAKLDKAVDTSFLSMNNLRKLIFKHFPEIEEIVERPPRTRGVLSPTHLLTIKCKDTVGDYITLESKDDLDAMELLQCSKVDFCIEVVPIPSPTIPSDRSPGVSSSRQSYKAPVRKRKRTEQCRQFQSGFCTYGEGCQFVHDSAKVSSNNWNKPFNAHIQRLDSGPVEVQQRAWRGSRSQDRLSSPRLGHPNLRSGTPEQLSMKLARKRDSSAFRYNHWINHQVELDSATNIVDLSGESYPMLSKFVNQGNLPHKTIALFVKLLVREEIRTSLLRQQTNKIYGALTGTPFLLQLNDHITSHLGMIPALKPRDVRPYLALTEEVQSRTMEGWKEVPLSALKLVVSKLEESSAKDDLVAIVSRLTVQCERVQRLLSVAPANQEQFQGEDFRKISILPGKDELLEFQGKQKLPVIGIGIQYSRVSDYLATHFRLLREDCIDPLRQGINRYCSTNNYTGNASAMLDLRIYRGVHLAGIRCGDAGVEFVVSFHLPSSDEQTAEDWASSKKLMFGALLCISSDQFKTFFLAVVARRNVTELAKGLVGIRLIGESDASFTGGFKRGRASSEAYVMVESPASYFEAYCHVLKTLQREDMENIPFTPYLLRLEHRVSPPSYLQRRKSGDKYDFSCAFPDIHEKLGKRCIRIMQSEWPCGWADSLDRAQHDALKQGLTKELAIIQGPPGTGKTFLGLILVKILLANLNSSPGHDLNELNLERSPGHDLNEVCQTSAEQDDEECDLTGPILIICYTNHALDQFLEGIYRDGERNLIRIGGRGNSELLQGNTLQNLLKEQKLDRGEDRNHLRLIATGRRVKGLSESKIHKCIDAMGLEIVTDSMLAGIATSEQRQSLFRIHQADDRSSTQTVKLWLTVTDPHLAQHLVTIDRDDRYSEGNKFSATGWSTKKRLRGQMKLLPNSEAKGDGGWRQVRRRGNPGPRRAGRQRPDVPVGQLELIEPDQDGTGRMLDIANEGHAHPIKCAENNACNPDPVADFENNGVPIEQAVRLAPDVWQLTLPQRMLLHEHWLAERRRLHRQELRTLTEEYEQACKGLKEVEDEMKLSILRHAKVVGMTTTAGATHHDVLKSLKPEVVIVEEAAEVLEGHILACISPSVKHLILIGDHVQLKPSVAAYELAIKNKLDVSMFERLVRSGVEHVTLKEQRRMRPNISKLVRSLYLGSRDHDSVARYEDVSGMKSNVVFFDHKAEEDYGRNAAGTKVNSQEAMLVVELCLYLLNQGCYKPENIAILAMYTGQLRVIKRLLKPRILSRFSVNAIGAQPYQDPGADEINLLPRVSSVDDYQGEESDIIILSLVRSNSFVTKAGVGKIGFLNISNRICVALTRARKGLYIFGNADLLAQKSTLWKDVTTSMRNSGELGSQLELFCRNHPDTITTISRAQDFKEVEDGGCSLPCDFQLTCGHACPRRCHPGSHDLILCPKACLRRHDECRHFCKLVCHGSEDCPPCKVIVTKRLLYCDHQQEMECSNNLTEEVCHSDCVKSLECGHPCTNLCGRPCTTSCPEKVMKMMLCGHSTWIPCHQDPATFSCDKPCQALLSDCQHRCHGSCGSCKRGEVHIPCQQKCGRTLPCGHPCEAGCSLSCRPCRKGCQKKCFHSRCSESCGNLCTPCQEPCSWQCEHHKCEKRCHEICTRPRCDLPCPKLIRKCGHRCIGLCGEPCPEKCRFCHPWTLDVIMRMTLEEYEQSDRFVQLQDCRHIFEVSGLDTWMDANEVTRVDGSVAIKLKECPQCRTPVWRTHRYSNVVKKKHSQVEAVKEKMLGHDLAKKGHVLFEEGDHRGAIRAFQQALQRNPDLIEAQFGIGMAFFARDAYDKAIIHLSLLVERSSFAASLSKHIETAQGLSNASGLLDKHYRKSSRRAGDTIAIQAVVQWASALTQRTEFTSAIELCDAVLGRDPENQLAKEIREKAQKEEVQLVVQAMAADVGARGHWYTCPNGHFYTIGECGGAMQSSKCPDCKAVVGGGQHRLAAGNRHSNIDGSGTSAWPGH